jgi:hypothetical protein
VSSELSDAVVALEICICSCIMYSDTAVNIVTSSYQMRLSLQILVTVQICGKMYTMNLTCGERKAESKYGA